MATRALSAGRTCVGRVRPRIAWLLVLLVAAGAEPYRPAPKFDGKTIPDPPQQRAPWEAPATKLPRFLVTATAALFAQGVADPRGCEYREVEVGDGGIVTTHGFVLPGPSGEARRFAVGWDGVVYPALTVGAAADIDADVRSLAAGLKTKREEAIAKGMPRGGYGVGFTGLSRGVFFAVGQKIVGPASVETASALKVCLLLRLGRADLAEALFAGGTIWTPATPRRDLTDYHLSELMLAQEWANRVYNRAADAHGRGDDAVALDAARRVAAFTKAAGVRLAELGFPRLEWRRVGGEPVPYFSNLEQLGDLLADQERRAQEPPRGPVPGPEAPAAARVAALIRDLDQVGGSGMMMNGIASPDGSKVVPALVREGDAAVAPLLAVLESDNRLNRTVSYPGSRHGGDDRSISYVYVIAHSALTGLMKTRVIPGATGYVQHNDPAARKREAAAIRAFWEKNRGVPELELHYRTLADDQATPAQWLDAAEALVQPADVRGRGGSYTVPFRAGGKVPPPRGEPLRERKDPGVTALIARRVESLDPGASRAVPTQGSGDVFRVRDANRLAGFLAAWDPKGALPTLKARVDRCAAIVKASEGQTSRPEGLEADIARLTLLRLKGDDPRALDDYAGWVRTVTPSGFSGFFPVGMFEPMWKNPDHPAVAAAAGALFGDPKSPWVPLFRPQERGWGGSSYKAGLVTSPLLGVAPFRALVLAGLADRRASGSVDTDAAGKIAVRLDDGMTTFPEPSQTDPLRPAPSTSMPLRLADLYCWTLQDLGGAPACELYWPEAMRDEAIAACAAFLRHYGALFRPNPAAGSLADSIPSFNGHPTAVLTFDRLDHPATPEDVRAGRSVFRLDGAGARVWSLPAYPLKARWTALEIPDDDPGLRGIDRSKGRPRGQIEMLQGGNVWQAEEAPEGGGWRRYYGFVGRHALARVPAEEVEFPAEWNTGWLPLSAGLDARIVPPGGRDDGTRIITRAVPPGAPLPFEVWVRNRRGVAVTVPTERAGDDGGESLRDGVTVHLFREREGPGAPQGQVHARVEDVIPARPARRRHAGGPSRSLDPAEAFPAVRADLKVLFTVDRPGRYRLEVAFDEWKTDGDEPGRVSAGFTLSGSPEAGQPTGPR